MEKNMLIITNASGEIIGAQIEENPTDEGISSFILPAEREHTLHRVLDVPATIYNLLDPAEFQAAITHHFKSEHAKVKQISAEEVGIYSVISRLSQKEKNDQC